MVKLAHTLDSGSSAARLVGSSPTRCTKESWPLRLSARTPGSHPGKSGSTPLGAAKGSEENAKDNLENGEVGLHRFFRLSGVAVFSRGAHTGCFCGVGVPQVSAAVARAACWVAVLRLYAWRSCS